MPKRIQYTLVQIPKKRKDGNSSTCTCKSCTHIVSGKHTDSSPVNRFKTSPTTIASSSSFSSAPLSTYLYLPILPIHTYTYLGGTCYLHRSSFFLHVLKKAKRLKESFSESASSVCYLLLLLLGGRKTYLMKRDVDYLPYCTDL